jgi:hypothetical protein
MHASSTHLALSSIEGLSTVHPNVITGIKIFPLIFDRSACCPPHNHVQTTTGTATSSDIAMGTSSATGLGAVTEEVVAERPVAVGVAEVRKEWRCTTGWQQ